MMRTDLTPPAVIRVNAVPANPGCCSTCGHPWALHSNGRTSCRGTGCTSRGKGTPCSGFTAELEGADALWKTEVSRMPDRRLRVSVTAPITCLVKTLDYYDSSPEPVWIASTVVMRVVSAGSTTVTEATTTEADAVFLAFFDTLQVT